MEWDLVFRFLYFMAGVTAALLFGALVWNARLLYYRIWCWYNYRNGHK